MCVGGDRFWKSLGMGWTGSNQSGWKGGASLNNQDNNRFPDIFSERVTEQILFFLINRKKNCISFITLVFFTHFDVSLPFYQTQLTNDLSILLTSAALFVQKMIIKVKFLEKKEYLPGLPFFHLL